MISAEAPVLFAKACELFILELTLKAWMHAEGGKRRTLARTDVAAIVNNTLILDFLVRNGGGGRISWGAVEERRELCVLAERVGSDRTNPTPTRPPGHAPSSPPQQDIITPEDAAAANPAGAGGGSPDGGAATAGAGGMAGGSSGGGGPMVYGGYPGGVMDPSLAMMYQQQQPPQ